MKPIDFIKAIGVAIALLAINVLIAILVVIVYRFLIEPGHPTEFYDEAAMKIAPWCSHIAGTALFFVASYFLTARRPDRNGPLFAAAVTRSTPSSTPRPSVLQVSLKLNSCCPCWQSSWRRSLVPTSRLVSQRKGQQLRSLEMITSEVVKQL